MPGIVEDKDGDDWIEKIVGDLSKESACKQIAIGSVTGWATGYLSMKVGKVVAIMVGGSILILQVAQHKGYVKINWDKVERQAEKALDKLENKTPSTMDKLERLVDRKMDKAAGFFNAKQKRARRWFDSFINNNGSSGYDLQELHLFIVSFGVGVALGLASG